MATKTIDRKPTRGSLSWVLIIILLILVAWFLYTRPPQGHKQIISDVPLPDNSQPCGQTSSSSLGFRFNCPLEEPSFTLQLSNVPDGVTPYLVPISAEDRTKFENAPKDGFTCPVSIIGNVVFADNETKNLITIFKSPIELRLSYQQAEATALQDCPIEPDHVAVPVPVFLYSYNSNDTNFSVWKPFQNYSSAAGVATIDFRVWGDPPTGVTIMSAPREWGPP